MPDSEPPSPQLIFSPSDIARKLGKNHTTIWRAIQRMGLMSAYRTGADYRFYTEAQVGEIETFLTSRRAS